MENLTILLYKLLGSSKGTLKPSSITDMCNSPNIHPMSNFEILSQLSSYTASLHQRNDGQQKVHCAGCFLKTSILTEAF